MMSKWLQLSNSLTIACHSSLVLEEHYIGVMAVCVESLDTDTLER